MVSPSPPSTIPEFGHSVDAPLHLRPGTHCLQGRLLASSSGRVGVPVASALGAGGKTAGGHIFAAGGLEPKQLVL
jgi:hypothetical protein